MTALALHRQTPGLSVSDPRGLTVRTVRYWRESGREQAQARSSRSGFDGAGRVVAEWDPRLVERANLTQVYSLGSKVLGSHSVDAGWRVSLFTQAAEQVQAWDARGNERQVEYDSLLRPVAVFEQAACVERHHYADASPHYAAHNQCGQLIRHDTPAGTQHFNEFGLTGAVLEQHQHFLQSLDMPDWPLPLDERDDLLEQAAGARSTLQFNPVGNVLEQTDAQGNRQRFNHTIDGRLREAWLQLKNATAAQRLVHDIHYNAQGQIEQQTAGNQVTSRFDYCPKDGRLNRLSAAGPSDEPLQDLHYVYDPVGNILSLEDKALPVRFFANQRIEPINRYTYDSLYQLIEATGWEGGSANRGPAHLEDPAAVANYRQTYRYDAGGNLLELIHHGPQQHGRVLTAAKHSNRCLPEVGGRPPTEAEIAEAFDASGNLLMLDRCRTLSWDARNQLSHVHMVERTLRLNDTERYVYGADGMR
ncbi:RHS repeat domain-containing protein, partial [Pseudomonas sp. 22072]|uniref:RHS repeat domain-containing protein n=1 Tax=Pseudomonas sp. 22072 TaxID=3453865 RepID=UPI003F831AC2